MPQVVDAQAGNPRGLAYRKPGLLHRDAMPRLAIGGEDPWRARLLAQPREQLLDRRAEGDDVGGLLLGSRARLGPDSARQLDVVPAHGHSLARAAAGEEAQAKDVSGLLIRV